MRSEPEIWQKVVEQIENGEMPPKDKEQLTPEHREQLLAWTKTYLNAEAHANAGDPGPVTLRRLNNAEYTYTVRDLTGITTLDPASEFPVDSAAGEGFTNTGDALVMSPALLEKYFTAGKEIAEHVVLLEDGFRFSPSTSRRDRANAIVDQIRALYLEKLKAPMIDFGYRSGKEVGEVRPTSTSEGLLNCKPYIHTLIAHREALKDASSASRIAGEAELNAQYLAILAKQLLGDRDDPSPLVDRLRQRLQTATVDEAPAIAEWIRGWQDRLWTFQSVGHLSIIRPWQAPANPMSDRSDLQWKLTPAGDGNSVELSLQAAPLGEENTVVLWEQPRVVRPGKSPVLLRDVPAATAAFSRYRSETLASLEQLLAIAFRAKQSNDTEVDTATLARDHAVSPDSVNALFSWLGIASSGETVIDEPLTGRIEQVAGQNEIQGWTQPGLADLSIIGNGTDATARIPGEAPPRRVVVHPRPERWIAAGWQSPISGNVRIAAHVQDRHSGCGNGVTWALQQRRGSQRRVLRSGEIGTGGIAPIEPVDRFAIRRGDLVSITIGSRDGNHSCDLTEIELTITEIDGEQRSWSLATDCASSMLAGNPHPDSHGDLAVWHFFYGLNEGDGNWQTIPDGSLLAEWMSATTESGASALGAKIAALATELVPNLVGPNAELYRQLTAVDGALFAHTDFTALAATATPQEIADSPYGLDPARFGSDGSLIAKAAAPIEPFTLPTNVFGKDATFTVTGRLHESSAAQAAAQLQLIAEETDATQLESLVSGVPITVGTGTGGDASIVHGFDAFRALFPAALCYTRIVPIDEVVTLVLYHREDEHLSRLMLTDEETARLNHLWDELHFVSQDEFQIVAGLEQILEFATQDADPSRFFPLREPIAKRAAALKARLAAAEPAQLDALMNFVPLAYRRPLTADENAHLRALYATLRDEEIPHEEAFRLMLARIFSSPQFLYRSENPFPAGKQGPVDPWELATRLSYFLSASTPDAELRQVAADGSLLDSNVLAAQTTRMLQDDKARRLAIQFACQWLHVRDFDQLDEKSESRFPEFGTLRGAMYEETILFFTDLFHNNGSILVILNADYLFTNYELATFYGLPEKPAGWHKVESARTKGRGGILAMATTLAKQSGASRTSPILRGNWVSETLLGEKLPKPPPGVPTLPETPPAGLTERELIEQHSSDPSCAKCHARIDPYGFALESYDAIGRLREMANTNTRLVDGTALNGLDGLRHYLADTRR